MYLFLYTLKSYLIWVTISIRNWPKVIFFLNFERSITFCFGVSLNLSQQKSPSAEILGKYFHWTIVPRKYMRKISAVGLFCCDKFEETPKQKVIDLSKFKNFYFRHVYNDGHKRVTKEIFGVIFQCNLLFEWFSKHL